jgi:hypothetical protein
MTSNNGFDVLQRSAAASGHPRLSPWDDLPLHNSATVLASSAPPQGNWAERYYFNLLRPTGEIAAVLGAGIYPGSGIAECYFCRIEGHKQHNVRVCQPLPLPGEQRCAAPFSLRCIAPMDTWEATVAVDGGRFEGRYNAITKPYHYSKVAVPASTPGGPVDDYQHVVAAGCWDLETLQGSADTADFLCIRDRTWGTRTRRQRLHNWLVFEVDGACLNVYHQERADGTVIYSESGVAWPDGRTERLQVQAYDFNFDPHTREARSGFFELAGGGGKLRLEYVTIGRGIRLNGAGYDDSQGERAPGTQTDLYDLSDPDEARRSGRGTIDIGARATITGAWRGVGMGVVESAVARDHVRFGSRIG